ncbi:MAG: D-glycero-beta-D-manno-heptose 1-phosphate adenylyltransferase [Prevotellaceae bacterium]|jgi:D-beta-D-heptose 7-phosphate kinase/D-beta-D-heptose 1-phosphate adenosyltransferase|nr:D-glycero-beta-D-manno-heptose 1-phosphate adenylyltransferase [Prevotellaceae bacterium]
MAQQTTIKTELERIRSRIHKNDINDLSKKLAYWRFKSYKIVFIYGNYDILDRKHIEYLTRVADFGNRLVVGLRSDDAAKRSGITELMHDEYTRATVLASLRFVSRVEIIDDVSPLEFIKFLKPHVLVDSKTDAKQAACYEIIIANGGKVELVD